MMMASAIKAVVMLLASLQLTQQASISSEFYNKELLNHVNNKLASYPNYNVPSVAKSKEYELIESEGLQMLNMDHGSDTNSRTKRQDNQDPDLDAEIISNDPEMFSYGKLMPMKTDDDDDTHRHHESISLDEDDAETSNELSMLQDNTKEGNETARKVEKVETHENGNRFLDTHSDATTHKPTDEERFDDTSSQRAHQNDTEGHDSRHTDVGGSSSHSQESYLEEAELASTNTPIQSQDDTHVNSNDNSDEPNVMSDEGYLTPNPPDQDNIEENLLDEEHDKGELKQNANVGKEDNAHLSANDMHEDKVNLHHNDEHVNKSTVGSEGGPTASDTPVILNSLEKHNENAEDISTEVFTNENEARLHDDTEEDGHLSRLRAPAPDNDIIDTEEGSGDAEGITTAPHVPLIMDGNEDNESKIDDSVPEDTALEVDNMDFNIDSDTTSEKTLGEEKESEEEPPISDPTQGASKVDNISAAEENTDKESPLPEPTENVSNDDLSKTYDPKTIVDPFNIDRGSDISKVIGKVLGILDHFETTTENEEFEGSGESIVFPDNEPDKESLEDRAAEVNIYHRILGNNGNSSDSDDDVPKKEEHTEEKEVTELPMVTKHQYNLFGPVQGVAINEKTRNANGSEEIATQSAVANEEVTISNPTTDLPIETTVGISIEAAGDVGEEIPGRTNEPENGYDLPLIPAVNTVGLTNDKIQEASSDDSASTSSSSTGSFIVLGAIMVIIVLLLGYSVIKSRRQKQRNVRRSPPEENEGTELKEKITLLPEENGHGPGNGNMETGKLMNINEESDKNDVQDDYSFPSSKVVNGENGTGNQYNNAEDPNILTEVKVNKPNVGNPNTLDNPNQPVANGVGLKNSPPDSSRHSDEPSSLSADDKISLVHGTKPEITKAKMFIDTDSIPKTPIVIVKRGPANVEM